MPGNFTFCSLFVRHRIPDGRPQTKTGDITPDYRKPETTKLGKRGKQSTARIPADEGLTTDLGTSEGEVTLQLLRHSSNQFSTIKSRDRNSRLLNRLCKQVDCGGKRYRKNRPSNRDPLDDVAGDFFIAAVVEAGGTRVGVAGQALDVFEGHALFQ